MATLLQDFEARAAIAIEVSERPAIDEALIGLRDRGRASWPELVVDDAAFVACVAARVRGPNQVAAEISALPADDVYLASGCAQGDAAAIARFEDRYFSGAREALRRMGRDAAEIADTMQRLRQRLFVAEPSGVARVCAFVGGGDLGALVRIAAVRLALTAQRDDHRVAGDPDPLLAQLALDLDPRSELVTAEACAAVESALADSLADLAPRDRSLLKLHLVQGLSIDEIGATFGAHRSTAARWLARIRGELEDGTLRRLRDRLGIANDELSSLMRLVIDRLEISFSRLLATPPGSRSDSR